VEEPARALTVRWDDPAPAAEAARGMSGLEYLRAMADGRLPWPPIARLVGFDAEGGAIEAGRVVITCTPGEQHYNPIGSVHGGLACTLLDTAMSCAVHTTLPAGVGYTTLELKVNLVRPIGLETGRVRAEGTVVHPGRRVATAEGRLVAERDGKLLAHATATCLVVPAPASAGA
jgi:uncharacterized protein (TIGR00369 family)